MQNFLNQRLEPRCLQISYSGRISVLSARFLGFSALRLISFGWCFFMPRDRLRTTFFCDLIRPSPSLGFAIETIRPIKIGWFRILSHSAQVPEFVELRPLTPKLMDVSVVASNF
jgi:hypothetical protein